MWCTQTKGTSWVAVVACFLTAAVYVVAIEWRLKHCGLHMRQVRDVVCCGVGVWDDKHTDTDSDDEARGGGFMSQVLSPISC